MASSCFLIEGGGTLHRRLTPFYNHCPVKLFNCDTACLHSKSYWACHVGLQLSGPCRFSNLLPKKLPWPNLVFRSSYSNTGRIDCNSSILTTLVLQRERESYWERMLKMENTDATCSNSHFSIEKNKERERILFLTMKYKKGNRDWIGRAVDRKTQQSYVNF